ncbi:stress responsive A/B Barrel Domain superfamily protein [Vibrio cholerae]|nr:stress responsive A/B Barrel Domain superfamily protein [Vibrio cholerae]
MIRHILLIKFKASAEPSEIEKLKGLFASMPDKVDGVYLLSGEKMIVLKVKIKAIHIRF